MWLALEFQRKVATASRDPGPLLRYFLPEGRGCDSLTRPRPAAPLFPPRGPGPQM